MLILLIAAFGFNLRPQTRVVCQSRETSCRLCFYARVQRKSRRAISTSTCDLDVQLVVSEAILHMSRHDSQLLTISEVVPCHLTLYVKSSSPNFCGRWLLLTITLALNTCYLCYILIRFALPPSISSPNLVLTLLLPLVVFDMPFGIPSLIPRRFSMPKSKSYCRV